MWTLTIIQKRPSNYGMLEDKVVFESEDLGELSLTVIRLAQFDKNTSFKIERKEEESRCNSES